MEKWRIDNSYEKVYRYESDERAYVFYGSFFACGITKEMTENEQIGVLNDGEFDD